MKTRRLIVLVLVLGLLIPVTAAAAPSTSPLHSAGLRDSVAGPCTAGAAYNPACDIDHNGVIDIGSATTTR